MFTERVSSASSPTRDRLLDEAMRLFGERGYDATSVAEIERSAGLTPGAGGLFHHFRTKEAVLVAGIERQLARLEAVRQIRGTSTSQVADCELVLLAGANTDPTGAILLRR